MLLISCGKTKINPTPLKEMHRWCCGFMGRPGVITSIPKALSQDLAYLSFDDVSHEPIAAQY
jgi:hypothetical protein